MFDLVAEVPMQPPGQLRVRLSMLQATLQPEKPPLGQPRSLGVDLPHGPQTPEPLDCKQGTRLSSRRAQTKTVGRSNQPLPNRSQLLLGVPWAVPPIRRSPNAVGSSRMAGTPTPVSSAARAACSSARPCSGTTQPRINAGRQTVASMNFKPNRYAVSSILDPRMSGCRVHVCARRPELFRPISRKRTAVDTWWSKSIRRDRLKIIFMDCHRTRKFSGLVCQAVRAAEIVLSGFIWKLAD